MCIRDSLGGVASGKSLVARLLAGAEGRVLCADALAREALESPAVVSRIREAFGEGVLDGSGRPDREALAALVFADPEARRRLEGWTHPAVRARILEGLAEARAAGIPLVVLDVPLLLENDAQHGLVSQCTALVFVDVSDAERDRRARDERRWKPGEVARREAAQLPLSEKRKRADFVIRNEGSEEQLERAVRAVRERIGAA